MSAPIPREHYQHPLDVESLLNLRAVKWFESLSKYLVAEDLESDFYILNLADNVLLTEAQFPRLHATLDRACAVLGIAAKPKVFLDTNPAPHSLCIGDSRPMLILSSGLLELLDEIELDAAIAHEMGHLACSHTYYQLLAENFSSLSQLSSSVPGLAIASFTLKIPLFDWYRKADLTADRAAFLVLRSVEPLIAMIAKVAGGSSRLAASLTTESLVAQATELKRFTSDLKAGNIRKKAAYFFSNIVMQGMLRKQPWPALRALEILEWSRAQHAQDLLAGKAPEPARAAEAQAEDKRWFFQRWGDSIVSAGKSAMFWDWEKDAKKPASDDGA